MKSTMIAAVKGHLYKVLIGVACLGVSAYELGSKYLAPVKAADALAKNAGEKVEVEFVCQSGFGGKSARTGWVGVILNDYAYQRGTEAPAGSLTVAFAGGDAAANEAFVRSLKGKKVVARGVVSERNGKKQVVVSALGDVSVR